MGLIFQVTDAMGIDRESISVPLGKEDPGAVRKLPTGEVEIVVPETMHIRKASFHFHQAGIFLNSVEYPAVPADKQRFRISLMATHTRADIDRLIDVVAEVWDRFEFSLDVDPNAVKKPHVTGRTASRGGHPAAA